MIEADSGQNRGTYPIREAFKARRIRTRPIEIQSIIEKKPWISTRVVICIKRMNTIRKVLIIEARKRMNKDQPLTPPRQKRRILRRFRGELGVEPRISNVLMALLLERPSKVGTVVGARNHERDLGIFALSVTLGG